MALITCKECGKEHSDTVASCPHCGFKRSAIKQSDQQYFKGKKKSSCMSWIVAILIVIVLTAILIFMVVKQNIKDLKGEAQYTWEHGTYLAVRKENSFAINLYSVDKFFVEVFYNPEELKINKIRSFKSKRCLEPYLDKITMDI
jgi:hypothetical protein